MYGPKLGSQKPHGSSQLPVTQDPGLWCLLPVSVGTAHTRYTDMQAKHPYTSKIINLNRNRAGREPIILALETWRQEGG